MGAGETARKLRLASSAVLCLVALILVMATKQVQSLTTIVQQESMNLTVAIAGASDSVLASGCQMRTKIIG